MEISFINSHEELDTYAGPIDDLARHASEPNVFFERWMLRPALENLSDGTPSP